MTSTVGVIHDGDGQLKALGEAGAQQILRSHPNTAGDHGRINQHNPYQKNLIEGKPNNWWWCRAGGRYLYICEDGLVHYCSQQRGYPGIPLEKYGVEDIRREYLTKKSCAPYCTISCVHQTSIVDRWRDPQVFEFSSPPKNIVSIASAPKGSRTTRAGRIKQGLFHPRDGPRVALPAQPGIRSPASRRERIAPVALYAVLLQARFRDTLAAEHLRNWIPLALMLLATIKKWAGSRPRRICLEQSWIVWDRMAFSMNGLRYAIESTGPIIRGPRDLLGYLLVYALPAFSMTMLYLFRKSQRADSLLVIYLLGLSQLHSVSVLAHLRTAARCLPRRDGSTVETAIRQFNQWDTGGYGIHTSVFPALMSRARSRRLSD